MGLRLSPHQAQGFCSMCAEDASANNHCAWCGRTYMSEDELLNHLDGRCGQQMQAAIDEYMGGNGRVTDRENVTLAEVRNEMVRLTRLLMKANDRYLAREQELVNLHDSGAQNYTGALMTVLDNDVLLTAYSGASKTLATLVTACAAVIQAEIAYATTKGGRRGGTKPC